MDGGSILTAPPFGFSPELPLRRPGGPTARPASSLPDGIRESLRRLRGLNLSLSLCRVSLVPGSDGRLTALEDAHFIAEPTADGALVVVFIYPPGVNDSAAAEQVLSRDLAAGLDRHGLASQAVRIAVLHCDAAAIDDGQALVALLSEQPQRPLNARYAGP